MPGELTDCLITDPSASLFLEAYRNPAYVDEVGLGAIAGELVACAVIIPTPFTMPGVKDSKQISHDKIYDMAPRLRKKVLFSYGIVDCDELNSLKNMHKANQLALKRAVEGLSQKPDGVFVDGPYHIEGLSMPTHPIIKGDNKVFGIAVASIIAKDYRDHLIIDKYSKDFPQYHLESNKGYGSPDHLIGIRFHSAQPFHRRWMPRIKRAENGYYDGIYKYKYREKWEGASTAVAFND